MTAFTPVSSTLAGFLLTLGFFSGLGGACIGSASIAFAAGAPACFATAAATAAAASFCCLAFFAAAAFFFFALASKSSSSESSGISTSESSSRSAASFRCAAFFLPLPARNATARCGDGMGDSEEWETM